ncbi:TPA: hypothetical protein ACH3X1_006787 [Trebouxia sp. C0004]
MALTAPHAALNMRRQHNTGFEQQQQQQCQATPVIRDPMQSLSKLHLHAKLMDIMRLRGQCAMLIEANEKAEEEEEK